MLPFLTFIANIKKIRQNHAKQALQAYRRLVDSDARIWLAVTLYGLAAGIISYAATLSYEDNNIGGLALVMNFPTFLVLFSSGSISIPEYIYPLVIIGASTAVWSFVGFIVYLFVWMFRLGP